MAISRLSILLELAGILSICGQGNAAVAGYEGKVSSKARFSSTSLSNFRLGDGIRIFDTQVHLPRVSVGSLDDDFRRARR